MSPLESPFPPSPRLLFPRNIAGRLALPFLRGGGHSLFPTGCPSLLPLLSAALLPALPPVPFSAPPSSFGFARDERRRASPPPVEQSFCSSSASTPCLKAFPCIAATGTSGASASKGPVALGSAP